MFTFYQSKSFKSSSLQSISNLFKRNRKLTLLFCFGFSFILLARIYPLGDQISSERFLAENRRFIKFADTAATNFGGDTEKELFQEAGKYDFWAQVAFLQSKYKRTYKEVRKSQFTMVDLYNRLIDIYLQDTKRILDRIAPTIIRSKDDKAKLYLSLGYRDITEAKEQEVVALHSNKNLYSYKIKRYIEGIKLCRRGKRYAILAIIQARTPRERKKAIENLTYEEIGGKLKELQNNGDKQVQAEFQLILHHIDNNSKTITEETLYEQFSKTYRVKGLSGSLTPQEQSALNQDSNESPSADPAPE